MAGRSAFDRTRTYPDHIYPVRIRQPRLKRFQMALQGVNMHGAGGRLKAKLAKCASSVRASCAKITKEALSKTASISSLSVSATYEYLTRFEGVSEYQRHGLNPMIAEIITQYFRALSPTLHKYKCEMTTIEVGASSHKFFVHEMLLSLNSEFFQVCFKSDLNSYRWKEGRQRKVELPEDDPAVFAMYMRYLYTSRCILLPYDKLLEVVGPDGEVKRILHGEFLFRCYIFAEKILASSFKNKLIEAIIYRFNQNNDDYTHPFMKSAALLWANLPESSKLRRLYLDIWTWCGQESWVSEGRALVGSDMRNAPYEFWQELAVHQWHFRAQVHRANDMSVDFSAALETDRAINTPPWIINKGQYYEMNRETAAFPPQMLPQRVRGALPLIDLP